MISDETLGQLESLLLRCDPPPWRSIVKGRDQESGDSFIQTGQDGDRGANTYVGRDSGPATAAYLDLVALVVSSMPKLIFEMRLLRSRPAKSARGLKAGA